MRQIVLFFLVCLLMSALLIVVVSVYAGYEQKPDPNGTFKRLLLRQNRFLDSLSQYTQKDVELIASYPHLPDMNGGFDFKPGPQVWVSPDYTKAAIFYFSQGEGEWSCYQVEPLWDHEAEKWNY